MGDHKTEAELKAILDTAATQVEVGATYRHYKGMGYTVVALALLEETLEPSVVYHAEYGEGITYVRPLSSWLGTVEVEGKPVLRFTEIEE